MKYIKTQDLLNQDTLTYQQILNLKKRFSGYTKNTDVRFADAEFKEEYRLTPEHEQKSIKYLERVAFKPSKLAEQKAKFETQGLLDSAIRSNSPLGYRELNILLQFDHFTFTGFYDATRSPYARDAGYRILYPLWKCYDKDGASFEYYLEAGEIHIIA